MTDILVLTLTLLIAWGAYTLVGKDSNEKSKGILSLAYIFCIMTAMEYYQGGIAGCIVILSISLALIFLRYLWKSGHKLPWTITLLAEWTFPSSSITHWIDSADYPAEYVWQLHLHPPS